MECALPMYGARVPSHVQEDALEQLCPCATTTERELWSPGAITTENPHILDPVLQNMRSLCTAAANTESLLTATKSQQNQNN